MKTALLAALAVGITAALSPSFAAARILPARQVVFEFVVCRGDPRGSREAGTVNIVARPILVTLDKRMAGFSSSQPVLVPDGSGGMTTLVIGTKLEITPRSVGDGKVRLDIHMTNSTLGKRANGDAYVNEKTNRTVGTFVLGAKSRIAPVGTGADQIWVEFVVKEVLR